MDNFKDFQGKDLDDCIRLAREYFNAPREKLEIEFIQDAKSGIFGIVGARKAKIRARRARLPRAENPEPQTEREPAPRQSAPFSPPPEPCPAPESETIANVETDDDYSPEDDGEKLAVHPLDELDREKLEAVALETARQLINPIAGREAPIKLEFERGLVIIRVEWEGDAGLLIGRDGQTLAAAQYLAARIISKAMNAAFRVRVDIGDYRARQEDKLRALAKNLAEKARQNGRSYATRPLSSYHRRIVHLCLQDDPYVQTRSSGDGPLKRVLVAPRRQNGRS